MPADKKTYSLDDIKPLSAMNIEPTTPHDYMGLPAISGKPTDIFSSLESRFQEIMSSDRESVRQRPLKSAAVREQNPDAINIPKARIDLDDILGTPMM